MTRMRLAAVAGLATAFCLLAPISARAKDTNLLMGDQGMEARLFRTAVDTKGHLTVDATPILPHLAISLGLTLDFGFNQWVAVEQNDNEVTYGEGSDLVSYYAPYENTYVDTYIFSVLMLNFGLFDMFVLGAQIPLVIPSGRAYDENIRNGVPEADSAGWSTRGGIGDIAFHIKARWLRADYHPIGIGTLVQIQTPVGKPELLMGDPGGAVSGKLIIDTEPISWYRAAINVGARYSFKSETDNYLNTKFADEGRVGPTGEKLLLFKYGPLFSFGVGQSFSFWPEVMDFVLEFYGNQLISEFGNMAYFSTEVSGSFKMFVERNSYLMAGYAHGLPVSGTRSGYGLLNVEHRMFIGFAFEPSMGDRDFDGLKDDVDKCPDDPEDFDEFEDSDGCPDPDNDRDGILDVEDDCPLVPEDFDNDNDEDGCPERGTADRDGDGILDEVDQCPDDPEDLDGFEDENGCPEPDNDGDGILDVNDICPNEPEDVDGFEDENGCPDPDNDADRIPDVDDQCPNEPETYNGKDDEDGCPDKGDVVLTATDIKILKKVYFEYDSAVIKEVSYDILNAVAATIIMNPQIDLIEVQGHADERGNDDYNLRLTADRAAAVMTYLVNKGVPAGKLRSVGYGEYCPVDEGHNEAAWEQNRRVEFKVLMIDGNPTGVDPACPKAKAMGVGSK